MQSYSTFYYIGIRTFNFSSSCVYRFVQLSPVAAQIFSSPLFTRARLPTSFLNRLICIPGTCVSRHNMQIARPCVSLYRLSLEQRIHLRRTEPGGPSGASFLLIIAIYYNFHSPFPLISSAFSIVPSNPTWILRDYVIVRPKYTWFRVNVNFHCRRINGG